jgi:hypothetical protein
MYLLNYLTLLGFVQDVFKLCAINDREFEDVSVTQKGPMNIGPEMFCKKLQRVEFQEHIVLQGWLSLYDVRGCVYK